MMITIARKCTQQMANQAFLIYKLTSHFSQIRTRKPSITKKKIKNNNLQSAQSSFKIKQPQSKQQQQAQTEEVLKTYLEIIPPYKIQQMLQPQAFELTNYHNIGLQRALSSQQMKSLYKHIKKNVHMMKIQDLGQLLETFNTDLHIAEYSQPQNRNTLVLYKKIENRIINIVRKKIHILSLQQIVNFMYKMVKSNKRQFQFMKEVERVIIQEKIPINYSMIRKILFSFTHLDVGSSVLYSHVSKTLKVGQHELAPLQLAESAYMLSKVSENVSGGYGIFIIAQKHLENSLPRLSFNELVKAASYMLTQNIGSNKFQFKLEQALYKKFPNKISLGANELVSLLKSTSGYYFKYKDAALLHMLKGSTERMADNLTLQQLEDTIWSWGRAGKGDKELWSVMQSILKRKYLSFLKPRQVSFIYHAFCSTQHSDEVIRLLEERFLIQIDNRQKQVKLKEGAVLPHYILKFLLGMQKHKSPNSEMFLRLTKILCQKIPTLSQKQLMSLTNIINESDLHYASKQSSQQSQLILELEKVLISRLSENITNKLYLFKIGEIVQILYMWIKLDLSEKDPTSTKSLAFTQTMFKQLEQNIINIPKKSFIKAMFCFVIRDRIKPALYMIPILYQLMKYGPIGYFFSPYELPLLAYCIYHLQVNSNKPINIKKQLISQLGESIQEINPAILNSFIKNGYNQALVLKNKYQQAQRK